MLGYCWKAEQYPWIHHWVHKEQGEPVYYGMEFGTAALHLNWQELNEKYNWQFMNQPVSFFLDAGEARTFQYFVFLHLIPDSCSDIFRIELNPESIQLDFDRESQILHL